MSKIIAIFEDDRKGGAETALFGICNELKGESIEIKLIALKCESGDTNRIPMDTYMSARKSSLGLFKLILLMLFGRIRKPSHIILNGRTSFFFAPIFSCMTNVIYRETNLVTDILFLRKFIMNFVDKLIISNPSMNFALRSQISGNVYLINRLNGQPINLKRDKVASKSRYLFVGRNSEQKNFKLFNDFLNAENYPYCADVYGRGFETMIGHDRMKFHGFTDWTTNLLGHEILVLTSKYEGTPNVVLEAINNRIGVILPKKIYDECQMSKLFHYNYLQYFETYTINDIKESTSRLLKIMTTEEPVLSVLDNNHKGIKDLCNDLQ